MFESLLTSHHLDSVEAQRQLDDLQVDSLRLYLVTASIGYVAWHLVTSLTATSERDANAVYLVLPLAAPVLLGGVLLLGRHRRAAMVIAFAGLPLLIAWTMFVFATVRPVSLLALVALGASLVVNPLGGIAVTAFDVGLLALLGEARPGMVAPVDVWEVILFSLLAVGAVAVLRYHLFVALNWYADSYAQAEQRTREAREHRAQLAQAWQQLDGAYHRLELATAALQRAWKAADEAERATLELAVNVSHELRTPLNLIVGYSEMMLGAPASYGGIPLPAPYWGDLNAVYRAAQHLLAFTDDILDLARVEVGRLSVQLEPAELDQVVREATALVADYLRAKGLDFRVELPDRVPTLAIDRLRIRQVLLNFLANAARLTERGHVEVRVEQRADEVRVSVADTGPGIDPGDLPQIFERFVSRSKGRADWPAGAGLGLPISKRIIELHGGAMGVDSTLGVGTTFWFTLPYHPHVATDASPILPVSAASRAYVPPRQPSVVLVHPDAGLARRFQRQLDGVHVEWAPEISAAALLATELRAAALVVDLDLAEPARQLALPVVCCPLPHPRRRLHGMSVDGYLTKPITRDALEAAIARLDGPVRRVLIADDDERFARLLLRMLGSLRAEGAEYTVTLAYNGEEALDRVRSFPPDLLILDLAMPLLDGVGVLRRMAAEPGLSDVRVIVVSGHEESDGGAPLGDELRLRKGEGFRLGELTQLIGAIVTHLDRARSLPPGTEPGRQEGPPDRTAWPGTP